MAIRINGLSAVISGIEKKLRSKKISRLATNHLCNLIEEDTKQTIRDGRNPNKKNSAAIKGFKGKKTVENRMRLALKNKTHSDYSPKRSNLTLTGELVDSIKCKFNRLSRGFAFTLKSEGLHKKYVSTKGKPIGKKRVKNADIFAGQKEMGRDVLGIRTKTKKKVLKVLKEIYQSVF